MMTTERIKSEGVVKSKYCAVHGMLVVGQDLKALIVGKGFDFPIEDSGFLNFIADKAPFLYEVEGSQAEPPIFEFLSTLIVPSSDIAAGILQTVIYCASSREDRLGRPFSSWVASEYHRYMPELKSSFQDNNNGDSRTLHGLVAFHEKFTGEKQAAFVEMTRDSLSTVIQCDKGLSSKLVSFILLNDRQAAKDAVDFSYRKEIRDLFVENGTAASTTSDDDDGDFDRFGLVAAEVELVEGGIAPGVERVAQILVKRTNYIIRWQYQCPETVKQFLEGKLTDAPSAIVPYFEGGTGNFNFWQD